MDPSGAGLEDRAKFEGKDVYSRPDAPKPQQTDSNDTELSQKDPSSSFGLHQAKDEQSQTQDEEAQVLSKHLVGWRKFVRNFSPSWFSVIMGTGIVSNLLHQIPYNGTWLYWLSVIVFVLNVFLFCTFILIFIVRFSVYPEIWMVMIRHPNQSLFVGTFPIGLATIINMIVLVCVQAWGTWTVYFAWGLWWFDVVLSAASCFFLPFEIMYVHRTQLNTITATWLLPVAATIVAAATGGLVADALPNAQYALWTVITSYILWGTGVPLAMTILVIYFQRLTIHTLPPAEVIVSVFLPIGPLGLGGFSIMQLGRVASRVFPETNTLIIHGTSSGDILYVFGFLVALIMWGFGLVWLFFALASISRCRFPFNMGMWGFTFPLGVYALSTISMGNEMPSTFFKILGTIFSVAVIILWIIVAVGTAIKAYTGEIFFAPCLKDLEGKEYLADQKLGGKTA